MENKRIISKEDKKKKYSLKSINMIEMHMLIPSSVSFFPSGNMISSTWTGEIIIYDTNYNITQTIEKAHEKPITYLSIKDENNFITCSYDKNIKTWIKKNNKFILNNVILNAHNNIINKVMYISKDNIISFSDDEKVKIWEIKKDNKYQSIGIFEFGKVKSSILLKDKNELIFSGQNGTYLFNLNNFELIKSFNKVKCFWWNAMCRIDDDKIIIGSTSLVIISLPKKEIIKNIILPLVCFTIIGDTKKGIFYVAGYGNDIMIYESDNFEYIETMKDAHYKPITGFTLMKNGSLVSYSNDDTIKIWS